VRSPAAFREPTLPRAPFSPPRCSYIQHESGDRVLCPNGEAECAGNLIQLCVQRHTPPENNYSWFYRFLLCSWDSGLPSNSRDMARACLDKVGEGMLGPGGKRSASGLPTLALAVCQHREVRLRQNDVHWERRAPGRRGCNTHEPHPPRPAPEPPQVGATGKPREAMHACMDGREGAALMEQSALTIAERNAWSGCIVEVDGARTCVRDEGTWCGARRMEGGRLGAAWRVCTGGAVRAAAVQARCVQDAG
jgi:hypothetical protein